jgi:hypothetical protein
MVHGRFNASELRLPLDRFDGLAGGFDRRDARHVVGSETGDGAVEDAREAEF